MKKSFFFVTLLLSHFMPAISFSQNVGIGTETPAFKLDVNGRMRIKANPLNNVSNSPGIWFDDYRNGSLRMFFGMQDSIRGGFYGSGTGGVGWGFNFNSTSGNVGIGRTAASSRLELDDPNGGDIAFYNNGNFGGRIIPTDSTLQIYSANGSLNCIPDPCPAKDLILLPPVNILTGAFTGNVGIGTNAPAARLHVGTNVMIGSGSPASGYSLSVNGKIIAEELKVQMDASWPDYVFDKTYKLSDIEEMKSFIEQHKHLKNIPSAKEVEKNGLLVGDMQKRMMEKIEELSLYIIQLHERLKQFEEKK